jgi:DnaK suppressor protein
MSAVNPAANKTELSPADMVRLKARLEAQVKALASKDRELRGSLAADEVASVNSFMDAHEGSVAAEANDEVVALLHHERAELTAAQQALERMARGDYGVCAECGEPIGLQRLEVVPDAPCCVNCQGEAERRHPH